MRKKGIRAGEPYGANCCPHAHWREPATAVSKHAPTHHLNTAAFKNHQPSAVSLILDRQCGQIVVRSGRTPLRASFRHLELPSSPANHRVGPLS